MSFGKVTNQTTASNQCNRTMQNYAIWIQMMMMIDRATAGFITRPNETSL